MIGVVQVGGMAYCDRYTYIPHIGLFAGIAASVGSRPGAWGKWPTLAGVVVGLIVFAVLTQRQLNHWRDSGRLWDQACRVVPDNPKAWHMRARHAAGQKDWPTAAAAQREALRLDPDNPIYQLLIDMAEIRRRSSGGSAP
ncbi:MAG: tetratricopeptide repeat protein [Fimbriiglobus sp.]